MTIAILFWAMLLAACVYAIALGGWEGRATTAIFVLAALATIASNRWLHIEWQQTNMGVFLVDLVTLASLYAVAALSRCWWPLWTVAFQLNSVAAHVATMLNPQFSSLVYQGYEGLWAIPCFLAMVFGIYRDRMGRYRHAFG